MILFKGITRDPTNADIGLWMSDRSQYYQFGYRRAAEKLVEGYADLQQRDKDSLVFPVIFLYRHHIELLLKNIIFEIETLLSVSTRYTTSSNHKLINLWNEALKLYGILVPRIPVDRLFVTISELNLQNDKIREFNKYDHTSSAFRYAKKKTGAKELPDIEYISVDNFQKEINSVLYCLDQVCETLCHESDMQREMKVLNNDCTY